MKTLSKFGVFDWSDWRDFMKRQHNVCVPDEIVIRGGDGEDFTKSIEEATLDEVSSAAVFLREKIRALNNALDGIYAIEEHTRRGCYSGSMKISAALGLVSSIDVDAYREVRKEEGKKISPENAEATAFNVRTLDPYGLDRDQPPVYQKFSYEIFVRNRDSDIWVWIGDIPADIRRALNDRPGGLLQMINEDDIPF